MAMVMPVTYGATNAIEAWTEYVEHDIYAYAEADFVYQTWYVNKGVVDADPMWATNFTSMIYDRSPMTSDYKWNSVHGYGQQNGSYLQVYCHTYTEQNGPIPVNQVPKLSYAGVTPDHPLSASADPVSAVRQLDEGTTFAWGGGEATYCWTIDVRSYVKFNMSALNLMYDKKVEGVLDHVDLVLTQAPTFSPTGKETDADWTIYIRPLLYQSVLTGPLEGSAYNGDQIIDAIGAEPTIPLDGAWSTEILHDWFLDDTGPYSVGLGHDTTTGTVQLLGMTEEQACVVDTMQSGMNGFRTRISNQNQSAALTMIRSTENVGMRADPNSSLPWPYTGPSREFDFYDESQVTENNRYDTKTIIISLDTKYTSMTGGGGHSFFYDIAYHNETWLDLANNWLEFTANIGQMGGWYVGAPDEDNEPVYYDIAYQNIPNKFSINPTIEDIFAGVPTSAYGYDTGDSRREAQAYATDAYSATQSYIGTMFRPYQDGWWVSVTRDTTIQASALFYGADEFSPTYVDNDNVMHGAGSYGELAGNSGQWNYNNFDPWDIDRPKIDPDTARPYIHGVWIETIEHPGVNMETFGMYLWIAVAVAIILLAVELYRRR
jgi:hypothetical protein